VKMSKRGASFYANDVAEFRAAESETASGGM
jgi:hypothetical protein